SWGAPPLTGPFMLAAVAYIISGAVLLLFLRPDPLLVAMAAAEQNRVREMPDPAEHLGSDMRISAVNRKGIIVGTTVMVLTQIVMTAIMTMTPVHMQHHGHDLGDVGIVIGIHVAAMFLPSLITGVLVDRFGPVAMSYVSGMTLL